MAFLIKLHEQLHILGKNVSETTFMSDETLDRVKYYLVGSQLQMVINILFSFSSFIIKFYSLVIAGGGGRKKKAAINDLIRI